MAAIEWWLFCGETAAQVDSCLLTCRCRLPPADRADARTLPGISEPFPNMFDPFNLSKNATPDVSFSVSPACPLPRLPAARPAGLPTCLLLDCSLG